MEILIDSHTLQRAQERGANKKEIIDVVLTGLPIAAKFGRTGRAKVFNFNKKRHDKFYEQKRVEVFYILENDKIVTVTVYAFYGRW